MGLYGGGPVTVTAATQSLNSMLGLSGVKGYKVSFMRAAADNTGTAWWTYTPGVNPGSNAAGFLSAGEAVSFDHPRPDTTEIFIIGSSFDVLHVTILSEGVAQGW